MTISPLLAQIALQFTSFEYFWIAVLGLSAAVIISRGSQVKGSIALLIGLLLAVVDRGPKTRRDWWQAACFLAPAGLRTGLRVARRRGIRSGRRPADAAWRELTATTIDVGVEVDERVTAGGTVLREPDLAKQLGRAGKEHVRKHFLTPRLLRDWLRIFRDDR
jgi:hypothetical protein